jgi:hypothetical protein
MSTDIMQGKEKKIQNFPNLLTQDEIEQGIFLKE